MITPSDIGLDGKKFPSFRPHQFQTAMKIIGSDKRFTVLKSPVGAGKTLTYISSMHLMQWRSLVLTYSVALQRQIERDFPKCVSIMGMGRYKCLKDGDYCDTGSCHVGHECDHRYTNCLFFSQVAKARAAKMVVGNYAFHHYGVGIGDFDFLVLDEVHKLLNVMTSLLEFRITHSEISYLLGRRRVKDVPEFDDPMRIWEKYLARMLEELNSLQSISSVDVKTKAMAKLKARDIESTVSLIKEESKNWVVTDLQGYGGVENKFRNGNAMRDSRGFKITPRWPGKYFETFLFKHIPRVLLVSATVTESSLQHMGINKKSYDFIDLPSLFDSRRRPFIFINLRSLKIKVDFRTTDRDFKRLVRCGIDEVIGKRLNVKGIIQTRSFFLARRILQFSRYANHMIINTTYDTNEVVRQFKSMDLPAILLSPSVESGYDFPGDQCRYQIILKVPFVDKRTDVMAMRCEFPGFADMLAVESLIQQYGRSTRSILDWSEVLIFDTHLYYFWKQNRRKFPQWFRDAYRRVDKLPLPMKARSSSKRN